MAFYIVVSERGQDPKTLNFEKVEITIGRVAGNDVVLPRGNISKRHSRIVVKDGKFIIVDLKSTNGTYVNGKKIGAPQVIRQSDKVYIGEYVLTVANGAAAAAEQRISHASEPSVSRKSRKSKAAAVEEDEESDSDSDSGSGSGSGGILDESPLSGGAQITRNDEDLPYDSPPDEDELEGGPTDRDAEARSKSSARPSTRQVTDSQILQSKVIPPEKPNSRVEPRQPLRAYERNRLADERRGSNKPAEHVRVQARLLKEVHDRLINFLDLRRLDIERLGDEELWRKTEKAIDEILDTMAGTGDLPKEVDRAVLREDVLNEALGLGPLEQFLGDDSVSEIMVNHAGQIYVERDGRLSLVDKQFSSNQAVLGVIERIVAPIGRRIDESSPLVDARLKDGSRVNAIIPPLALKGPCLTIRKFKREALKVEDLVSYSTVTQQMADFLEMCVKARKNIVISGGTGSGKTTTLNVLSGFIPSSERIVTIEDAAELQLPQEHWVQLESRPANLEGKGTITIRELVRNTLRMRPDRIVVGECRGGEALDMLQAMNTGHDGSLTTAHANSPRDCLARLETMVLMSGVELPVRAIREQISSAIDIIVQQTRFSDGSRRITHISEVSGMEVDVITLQDIFVFKQEGFDEAGRVRGRFVATGFVPKFYDDLQRRGIPVNMQIFREDA